MLQNNIFMLVKPISFFSKKTYIFCIQKSLILSSKHISFISEIRDFQIFNSQFLIFNYLEYSLCHHSLSYLHEAGYVGAFHVVYVTILLLSVFYALLVDVFHDALKFLVYFLAAPA